MSYEGTEWYLCERGHLSHEDATTAMCGGSQYSGKCIHCTAKLVLTYPQDTTNGEIQEYPDSLYPILDAVGFDDVPHEDHRGNKYVTQLWRYKVHDGSGRSWREYSYSKPFEQPL